MMFTRVDDLKVSYLAFMTWNHLIEYQGEEARRSLPLQGNDGDVSEMTVTGTWISSFAGTVVFLL